jgi:hypothetical protein
VVCQANPCLPDSRPARIGAALPIIASNGFRLSESHKTGGANRVASENKRKG